MWIRKSDEAIQAVLAQKAQRKKDLWRPVGWASLATVVAMLFYSMGLRSCSRGFVVVSNEPTRFGIRFALIAGLMFLTFVALAMYFQRRDGGLFSSDSAALCSECKEPRHANPGMRCSCGGRLEPFDYFDWIPEGEDGSGVQL